MAKRPEARKKASDQVANFILENVGEHPTDIVALAMAEFGLTRPSIHSHLQKLIDSKRIVKSGTRNKVSYRRTSLMVERDWLEAIKAEGDENRIWEENLEPLVKKLKTNIRDILRYSVCEMINNAIDHSAGSEIYIRYEETKAAVRVDIVDNGIGIFNKISKTLKLDDQREAILHLSKGKFTTDPKNHSGQGIFFTSRAVDEFAIRSGVLMYKRFRRESDWLIETRKDAEEGTLVRFVIEKHATTDLTEVFKTYSDEEDPGFNKTHVFVQMAKLTEEEYVSRSQARRLLLGLDQFEEIILDFKKVRVVGQGFVDEVFRVFKEKHPSIVLKFINANPDVKFMIERSHSN